MESYHRVVSFIKLYTTEIFDILAVLFHPTTSISYNITEIFYVFAVLLTPTTSTPHRIDWVQGILFTYHLFVCLSVCFVFLSAKVTLPVTSHLYKMLCLFLILILLECNTVRWHLCWPCGDLNLDRITNRKHSVSANTSCFNAISHSFMKEWSTLSL